MQDRQKKYITSDKQTPDTGQMLRDYINAHRIHQSAMARAMNRRVSCIMDYKKRKSMQTALLWEISIVLKHNFFLDIAAQLPVEFSTDAPYDASKDEQIARLTAENEKLRTERDLMKEILQSK